MAVTSTRRVMIEEMANTGRKATPPEVAELDTALAFLHETNGQHAPRNLQRRVALTADATRAQRQRCARRSQIQVRASTSATPSSLVIARR
jgi:hypothetical protein